MDDHKLKAISKLMSTMKHRTNKKIASETYKKGAQLSGMAGYLPDMKDGKNMELQRKKLNKAKPYDRIEKDK